MTVRLILGRFRFELIVQVGLWADMANWLRCEQALAEGCACPPLHVEDIVLDWLLTWIGKWSQTRIPGADQLIGIWPPAAFENLRRIGARIIIAGPSDVTTPFLSAFDSEVLARSAVRAIDLKGTAYDARDGTLAADDMCCVLRAMQTPPGAHTCEQTWFLALSMPVTG